MEETLQSFIHALRRAEVRISPAETLDATRVVNLVGYSDREMLRNSLRLILPKTPHEKHRFDECFERFFRIDEAAENAAANADSAQSQEGGEAGDGQADSQAAGSDAEGEEAGGGGGGDAEGRPRDARAMESRRGPKPKSRRLRQEQAQAAEDAALDAAGEVALPDPDTRLGQLLMNGDRAALQVAMAEAGEAVNLRSITVFTQRGVFTRRIMDAMGGRALDEEISELARGRSSGERLLAGRLKERRDALREQVRDYVERAFMLHADTEGKELRESLLRKVKLSNVEHRNYKDLQQIVQRMAKRLVSMHSQRKRITKRGALNVPKTIRANMSYDGTPFNLKWKSQRIDRPRVFAICDVSGSVAAYARFMLMFLYAMEAVMPRVRAFAFSSDLGEVTDVFRRMEIEDAMAHTMRDFGGGSTDYGQAFEDFRRLCLDDIDKRTTVIILGDARNNYGEPKTHRVKELYDRARRVMWLNPESEISWGQGDSEMHRYRAYCHTVRVCNTLVHLERVIADLLKFQN